MNKNNIKIGFTVLPHFSKVNAELYRVYDMDGIETHIHLINKEFGSIFRKPIDKDYKDARKWIKNQIKCIKIANDSIVFIE